MKHWKKFRAARAYTLKKSKRNLNELLKTFSRCATYMLRNHSEHWVKMFSRCARLYVKKSLRRLSDLLKKDEKIWKRWKKISGGAILMKWSIFKGEYHVTSDIFTRNFWGAILMKWSIFKAEYHVTSDNFTRKKWNCALFIVYQQLTPPSPPPPPTTTTCEKLTLGV